MTKRDFLGEIYRTDDAGKLRAIYDDWAASYEGELVEAGYATPERVAAMLATDADTAQPVLDFACGTGLSGRALARAGFGVIDGCDISEGMLARARSSGVYRRLWRGDGAAGTGRYHAIAAAGAISPGAAPASVMDGLVEALHPGGLFCFSLNDHALADHSYAGRLDALTGADGPCEILDRARGPHLPTIGLESTVFLIRRRPS